MENVCRPPSVPPNNPQVTQITERANGRVKEKERRAEQCKPTVLRPAWQQRPHRVRQTLGDHLTCAWPASRPAIAKSVCCAPAVRSVSVVVCCTPGRIMLLTGRVGDVTTHRAVLQGHASFLADHVPASSAPTPRTNGGGGTGTTRHCQPPSRSPGGAVSPLVT